MAEGLQGAACCVQLTSTLYINSYIRNPCFFQRMKNLKVTISKDVLLAYKIIALKHQGRNKLMMLCGINILS